MKTNGERTTENITRRKVTGIKVTVETEGGTMGQERLKTYKTTWALTFSILC